MAGILGLCRTGFESECAAEFSDHLGRLGLSGFARAKANSGHVYFEAGVELGELRNAMAQTALTDFVFARQILWTAGLCGELDERDRLTPLLQHAREVLLPALDAPRVHEIVAETPDTDEAKENLRFCRAFEVVFRKGLDAVGGMARRGVAGPVLHLVFPSKTSCYVGVGFPGKSSPWPLGIPRLRFPKGAPSRAALKLEEAILTLMTDCERNEVLREGACAVDLGAAPGGWTAVLVGRGVHVIAVDNGRMDSALMKTGLIEHLQVDGFTFEPSRKVHLMVCDIVDKPSRVADLVARWLAKGLCDCAVFNLKLPMKKRREEVLRCLEMVARAAPGLVVRCKQLYHDRDEVTCYCGRRMGS